MGDQYVFSLNVGADQNLLVLLLSIIFSPGLGFASGL